MRIEKFAAMTSRWPSRQVLPVIALALAFFAFTQVGCLRAEGSVVETETRSFSKSFPVREGGTVSLANLVGRVELVTGTGSEVVVETTVYAAGKNEAQTQSLLEEMKWVVDDSREGKGRWALAFPVRDHGTFHYNNPHRGWGHQGSAHYLGRKVRVTTRKGSHPTLYADLKVILPAGTRLALRNVMGDISGGELSGSFTLDTGSGDVSLATFEGELEVDTGSGDIDLGVIRGETDIDTGSGDIRVQELIGNAVMDTGSGDVRVHRVALGRLRIDTGSGDVVVENGSIGDLVVDTGSGEVQALQVSVRQVSIDTGSGDVVLEGPLVETERVVVDTGSGDVTILGSAEAAFDLDFDSGSGVLVVRYEDVRLQTSRGREITGASRGQGTARIQVETGSGDCIIGPAGA